MAKHRRVQTILDWGLPVIRFCSKCNLKYNSANPNDAKFHARIHGGRQVPKRGQVSKHIYQAGRRYILGKCRIEAWCEVLRDGRSSTVTNRWSVSEGAMFQLMEFLQQTVPNLKV